MQHFYEFLVTIDDLEQNCRSLITVLMNLIPFLIGLFNLHVKHFMHLLSHSFVTILSLQIVLYTLLCLNATSVYIGVDLYIR